MEAAFWLQRWQEGRTGWQEDEANGFLRTYFASLGLPPGGRVLVPLCGASPDIGWLLAQGYRVVGAELSGVAISQVFDGLGLVPEVSDLGKVIRHSVAGLDLFQGDIFDLTPAVVGEVDGIHDRAALFALPADVRPAYAAHLVRLTGGAPQLLNCFDYGGGPMEGPPFSIGREEVARLYGHHYRITLLASEDEILFSNGAPARSDLWHLARK